MIVVIEDGNVPAPQVSVRAHCRAAWIESAEIVSGGSQAFGNAVEDGTHLSDIQHGGEIAIESVEIVVLGIIPAGDLADEEEILLAEILCAFLDGAAEIPRLFLCYCLRVSIRNPSQSVRAIQYL